MLEKELNIGGIRKKNAVILAPMEGITDQPFRIVCKRLGADIVFSEFISSRGLVQNTRTSSEKMIFSDEEKPVAIQIFGSEKEPMIKAAKLIEDSGGDIVDINCGCWVKKVCNSGAGAALLSDPDHLAELVSQIVNAVNIPVTIKTRLGWDPGHVNIIEAAEKLNSTGIAAITIHCRTRDMAMNGEADWSLIPEIKKVFDKPVILNGDVKTPQDALRAFNETGCDAVMVARAAVGNPFIFKRMKSFLNTGADPGEPNADERIDACRQHLDLSIDFKGYPRGLIEFRKHYAGYLKGLYNSAKIRDRLLNAETKNEVDGIMMSYLEFLNARPTPYSQLIYKTPDNLTDARGVY